MEELKIEHRIVNGLHIVETNRRIKVYTEKEYRELKTQSSGWKISDEAKFFWSAMLMTAILWTLIIWGLTTSTPYNPV